jgi:hypothetical protein
MRNELLHSIFVMRADRYTKIHQIEAVFLGLDFGETYGG